MRPINDLSLLNAAKLCSKSPGTKVVIVDTNNKNSENSFEKMVNIIEEYKQHNDIKRCRCSKFKKDITFNNGSSMRFIDESDVATGRMFHLVLADEKIIEERYRWLQYLERQEEMEQRIECINANTAQFIDTGYVPNQNITDMVLNSIDDLRRSSEEFMERRHNGWRNPIWSSYFDYIKL